MSNKRTNEGTKKQRNKETNKKTNRAICSKSYDSICQGAFGLRNISERAIYIKLLGWLWYTGKHAEIFPIKTSKRLLWDVLLAGIFIHHFIPFHPCLLSTSEHYTCTLPVGCARSGCSSSSSGSILASGTSCLARQYVWCHCFIQSCTKTGSKTPGAPCSLYHLQLPAYAIQEINAN